MNKQQLVNDYIRTFWVDTGRIRYDLVSNKVQIKDGNVDVDVDVDENGSWRDCTKVDVNSIVCYLCDNMDSNITSREVNTAIQSNIVPQVHPLRDYLNNLPPWNRQTDWIDMLAQQVVVKNEGTPPAPLRGRGRDENVDVDENGNENENQNVDVDENVDENENQNQSQNYWRACFKKWFVAMVAAWMKDEVVNHHVIVLIGRQGIFKTTWLKHLIPPELRLYGSEFNINDLNKDERGRIAEYGLINIDELDALTPRELNLLKSLITAGDINDRLPYGYAKERRIRLASFCASGNRKDILSDTTGNRRWLCFEVESIQNPYECIIPYGQLYAQAKYLAEYGFNYWFDLQDIDAVERHNKDFYALSNEEELIPQYFLPATKSTDGAQHLTASEIIDELFHKSYIARPMNAAQVGQVMNRLGYEKVGHNSRYGYWVIVRTVEQVKQEHKAASSM